jgi:quinol monooxygenase YgiN
MVQVVWTFVVKPDAVEAFERAYGPSGDWARLFARYQGFLGTSLARDTANSLRFVTIDAWQSLADRQRMLEDAAAEYARLDKAFEDLTESEREIGTFDVVAPAR